VRNFLLFIRRFFNLILFVALEVICVVLIARTNNLQGNDIMSSANTVVGLLYQKQNDVVYYFGLKRMNDSLLNENMHLHQLLAKEQNTFYKVNDSTAKVAISTADSSHTIKYADFLFRTAKVVNNSVSAANNYITINRGSADGIAKNMAVITGSGIVGRVEHVSSHFSSLLSVLSVKQKVSAKLKDGTTGYIEWEGDRPDVLLMKDVPQQIKVHHGDSVFTTSYSFFPEGVLVGTIDRISLVKKNNLQILHLIPGANFRNLQYVYVIENKMDNERRALEDSVKNK